MKRGIALVVVLILLLAYPVSYWLLLKPRIWIHDCSGMRAVSFSGLGQSPKVLQVIYKPLILLDQKLRPEYWNWDETENLLGTAN